MNISIRHWFSALLVVTLFDNGVYCSGHSIIEKLLIKLLNGTNHLVRPVLDREESIEVTVGLELIQINKIDETQQYISSKFWSRIIWRNEFMKWNASEYHDMKFIQISAHKVWTPDIVLYNNAANNIGGGLELPNSKITMYPDGSHHWLFPVTYVSSCHMNVLYFPFDGHTCELKFGSWTFNSKYISLRYDDKPLITSHYIHSTEWDLINMNKSKNSIVYEGYGPIPYDDVTFEMKVSRVYLGYIFYMIAPCLLLIMTTLFSFSLPPESGERVTVIVTNLLAFSFFMNCTNEILPTNSDTITIITVFYLVLVAESAVSLLMAVCVLTVFHRGQQYNPPEVPSWLKSCFFRIYTKIYTVEQGEFTKKIPKTVAANLSSIALGALDINLQNETSADNLREKSGSATRLHTSAAILRQDFKQRPVSLMAMTCEANKSLTNFINTETATRCVHEELKFVTEVNHFYEKQEKIKEEWIIMGVMLDRIYFWIFLLSVSFSSAYMLLISYKHSIEFGANAMHVPHQH